jgi:hypothetical protein
MTQSVRRIVSSPARRVAGAGLCCALLTITGCFGGGGRGPAVLSSNDPGSKIPAIKKASDDPRDSETARQLVKSLESDDPAVRFYAIRGLQTLTGETFGYVWYVDEPDRRTAMDQWKRWLDAHAGSLAGGDEGPDKVR